MELYSSQMKDMKLEMQSMYHHGIQGGSKFAKFVQDWQPE